MSQSSQGDGLERELARRFPPEPGSASAARQFVNDLGWSEDDELSRRLSTAVSEVVTNAILHARTSFLVRVRLGEDRIKVSVSDGSSELPTKRFHDTLQPTGRGLLILSELADRWGISPVSAGKTVWFEIERGRASVEHG